MPTSPLAVTFNNGMVPFLEVAFAGPSMPDAHFGNWSSSKKARAHVLIASNRMTRCITVVIEPTFSCSIQIQYYHNIQELIRRWDTRTWRDVSSYMITYLPLNYDTMSCSTPEYFRSNAYISNGRRFTKSALRILLLSTFCVSGTNYSLACSLPIHTRSSTNAEGPRAHYQSTSCKMLHKCSTDCIWKSLQPVGHSRSLPCCHLIGHIWFPISLPL